MTITLKIGRVAIQRFATLAEAKKFYCEARNASFQGASTWPVGKVYTDEKRTHTISYNGRVWLGTESQTGMNEVEV